MCHARSTRTQEKEDGGAHHILGVQIQWQFGIFGGVLFLGKLRAISV